jgi:hypothetical protein
MSMGKVVDCRDTARKAAGTGARIVATTGADGKSMQADCIRLDANVRLEGQVHFPTATPQCAERA